MHTDPIPERSAGLTERQACEALIRALTQAINMWLRPAQKPADNSDDNSNHNDDKKCTENAIYKWSNNKYKY